MLQQLPSRYVFSFWLKHKSAAIEIHLKHLTTLWTVKIQSKIWILLYGIHYISWKTTHTWRLFHKNGECRKFMNIFLSSWSKQTRAAYSTMLNYILLSCLGIQIWEECGTPMIKFYCIFTKLILKSQYTPCNLFYYLENTHDKMMK